MKFYPYKYQKTAIDFIIKHDKCAIMLGLRMGKTVIALTAIYNLKYDYFEPSKVLVITSKKAIETIWLPELAKWEHLHTLKVSVISGTERKKKDALKKKADIYITNIECAQWLLEHNHFSFDVIVLDELSNYKNEKSKRFNTILTIRKHAKRLIALTSMPISNSFEDLWAEIYLIDAGQRLGRNKAGYLERYFYIERVWYGKKFKYKRVLKDGAKEAIYDAIADVCLTASSSEYIDLPIVSYENLYVEMNPNEYSRYRFMEKEMLIQLPQCNLLSAKNVSALSTKLVQMANGCIYDDDKRVHKLHQRKLDALELLIQETDKHILIAYWFEHDKRSLMERFKQARVIQTVADINDWNCGKIPVGLMNPAVGGTGIDMHWGGNILVWYSLTWSLRLYEQMNNRLMTMSTKEQIKIIHIITKRTLDEKIIEVLNRKEKEQEALLNAIQQLQEEENGRVSTG